MLSPVLFSPCPRWQREGVKRWGWGGWGCKGHLRGSRLGGHDKDKQVEACIVCTSSSRPQ